MMVSGSERFGGRASSPLSLGGLRARGEREENKMFFSRLAVLFAIVGFVIGVLSVLIGTAATMDLLDEVTRARYVIRSPEQIIYGGALGGGERWQLYSIGSRFLVAPIRGGRGPY